jgi:hypothetical protein
LLLGRNGPFTAQKAVKLRHLPPAGRPAARCLNALIQFDEAGAEASNGAIATPAFRVISHARNHDSGATSSGCRYPERVLSASRTRSGT